MKNLWKSGVLILLIIAVLYIIFLRECKQPDPCPAKGEILIAQQTWDSIQALADKPAITHIDTVYLKGKTIYIDKPVPVPTIDPKDTTINIYKDSLLKMDIDVQYTMKIRGELLNRNWSYNPIVTTIFRTDSIFVPRIVEVPLKVPQNGLFAYIIAGGNTNSFLFGSGADLITKKSTMIGYQYQRFGNDNIHSIRIGIKLFKK